VKGAADRDCREWTVCSKIDMASAESDSSAIGIELKSRMLWAVALLSPIVELERSGLHVDCVTVQSICDLECSPARYPYPMVKSP
jgi:hypothetical protein